MKIPFPHKQALFSRMSLDRVELKRNMSDQLTLCFLNRIWLLSVDSSNVKANKLAAFVFHMQAVFLIMAKHLRNYVGLL